MRRLTLAALVAVALLAACMDQEGAEASNGPAEASNGRDAADAAPAAAPEKEEREAVLVRVQPVKVGTIERKLEVAATIESLNVVEVIAEHSEPVVALLVEEGDEVEAGQVLASLRTEVCEMNQQEAKVRLEEARLRWEQSQRDHQRNQELAQTQGQSGRLVSERELDASAQAVVVAKTTYDAALVAKERAQYNLDRCVIRAPISGTVSARDISLGDFLSTGQRAFQITDLSAPKAIFYRPQRELGLLKTGQRLLATSEAHPGIVIEGEIERISPTVDAVSGTVKVTAALRPEGFQLPTGILVRINVVLDRHVDAILVPKRGLLYEGRRPYCYVVRDGAAVRIDCREGYEDPEYLEVLPGEDGLRPDDVIVVVGADRLAPGDPVILADE